MIKEIYLSDSSIKNITLIINKAHSEIIDLTRERGISLTCEFDDRFTIESFLNSTATFIQHLQNRENNYTDFEEIKFDLNWYNKQYQKVIDFINKK